MLCVTFPMQKGVTTYLICDPPDPPPPKGGDHGIQMIYEALPPTPAERRLLYAGVCGIYSFDDILYTCQNTLCFSNVLDSRHFLKEKRDGLKGKTDYFLVGFGYRAIYFL